MHGKRMTPNNLQEHHRDLTLWSFPVAIACSIPVLVLFNALDRIEMGIGASACSCVIILTVQYYWDLRAHPWFWATIFVATLAQIPVVIFIPWGDKYLTGRSLYPIAALDVGFI